MNSSYDKSTYDCYYIHSDYISDLSTLTALFLLFDKVHILDLMLSHQQCKSLLDKKLRESLAEITANESFINISPLWKNANFRLVRQKGLLNTFQEFEDFDKKNLKRIFLRWYEFLAHTYELQEAGILCSHEDGRDPISVIPNSVKEKWVALPNPSLNEIKDIWDFNRNCGIQHIMLKAASKNNGVPVTDGISIPNNSISYSDLSKYLPALLAIQVIKDETRLSFNGILQPDEILDAREKLKDQLLPFREEMRLLSNDIIKYLSLHRSLKASDKNLIDILQTLIEEKLINVTKSVRDIENRLNKEVSSSNLIRKLVGGAVGTLGISSGLAAFTPVSWEFVLLSFCGYLGKILFDAKTSRQQILDTEPLQYVIKLKKY